MPFLSRYRHGKSLFALGIFASALTVCGVSSPSTLSYLTNPLRLGAGWYLAFFVVKCAGLGLIDAVVDFYLKRAYADKPLQYRANTGATGLERLEWIDYLYLSLNSVVETAFTAHVIRLVLTSEEMKWHPADITIFNSLPALLLIFVVDDAFYAPAHKLMHASWFYPYVHKHHHRQNLPERGYLDAGNEHPVEQVIGLSCLYLALRLVSKITGVHAVTILVHFVMYAVLALLNHTNYDVRFNFFGLEYSVGAHETHHRYPQTNMAQYFMAWDKLVGTYKPYYDGLKKVE